MAYQKVEILLDCGHVNTIDIEAEIFVPQVGTVLVCQKCSKSQKVLKIGIPYTEKNENSKKTSTR